MRRRSLGAQCLALGDAEAVLLVDDRQRQVVEGDGVLDQGVRADDDAALAAAIEPRTRRADAIERLASRRSVAGTRSAGSPDGRAARGIVSASRRAGEPAGRSVPAGPPAGRRRRRWPWRGRHRGLARPDVSLEQAQHRPCGRQVGPDGGHGRLLVTGQLDGGRAARPCADLLGERRLDGAHDRRRVGRRRPRSRCPVARRRWRSRATMPTCKASSSSKASRPSARSLSLGSSGKCASSMARAMPGARASAGGRSSGRYSGYVEPTSSSARRMARRKTLAETPSVRR